MNIRRRWRLFIRDPSAIVVFISVVAFFLVFIKGELQDSFAIRGTINEFVGVVLLVVGFIISLIAKKQLGASWSPSIRIDSEEDKKIVTSGLYSIVRHPIYFGLVFILLGIDIYAADYVLWTMSVIVLVVVVIRIEFEEKELKNRFGEKYNAYAKKTKKIIPGIY